MFHVSQIYINSKCLMPWNGNCNTLWVTNSQDICICLVNEWEYLGKDENKAIKYDLCRYNPLANRLRTNVRRNSWGLLQSSHCKCASPIIIISIGDEFINYHRAVSLIPRTIILPHIYICCLFVCWSIM